MKNILLILLILIAAAMIFLGVQNDMLPPSLTGAGFVVIVVYLFIRDRN